MYLGRQNYKMVNAEINLPHNYISTGDPTIDVNPPILNMTWVNQTTGEMFVCTDNTAGANVWVGNGYRVIRPLGWEDVPNLAGYAALNGSLDYVWSGPGSASGYIVGTANWIADGLYNPNSFNATSGVIRTLFPPSQQPATDEATFSWWTRWPTDPAGDTPLWGHQSATVSRNIYSAWRSGEIYINEPSGLWDGDPSPTSYNFLGGTWYHFCITLSASGNAARFYINGVLVKVATTYAWDLDLSKYMFAIGGYVHGSTGFAYPSGAYIQEVRTWLRILTDEEISILYNDAFLKGYL